MFIDGFETHTREFGCCAGVEAPGKVVSEAFGVRQVEERQCLRNGIGDAFDRLGEPVPVGAVQFRQVRDNQCVLGAKWL